jgi:hypothetical protein
VLAEDLLTTLNDARARQRRGEPVDAQIIEVRETLEGHQRTLRAVDADRVERFAESLRRRRARATDPAQQAELDSLIQQADALAQRMRADPGLDARLSYDALRRQAERAGVQEYAVDIPLTDEALRAQVDEYFLDATAEFERYPGGDLLRQRFMQLLRSMDALSLTQSPRQGGRAVADTAAMRADVLRAMAAGHYPPEYVAEFNHAAEGTADGWPRTPDGRAWEVDHVMELWSGGADDMTNYLALDPRLHDLKSEILSTFRDLFRERLRVMDDQVDVRESGDFAGQSRPEPQQEPEE